MTVDIHKIVTNYKGAVLRTVSPLQCLSCAAITGGTFKGTF